MWSAVQPRRVHVFGLSEADVAKPTYVIDGTAFSTLQEFYEFFVAGLERQRGASSLSGRTQRSHGSDWDTLKKSNGVRSLSGQPFLTDW
jgi:hypothetical protein